MSVMEEMEKATLESRNGKKAISVWTFHSMGFMVCIHSQLVCSVLMFGTDLLLTKTGFIKYFSKTLL